MRFLERVAGRGRDARGTFAWMRAAAGFGAALCGTGFSQTAAAVPLTPRPDHPRLFFTAERIAGLKDRLARERTSAEAWRAILAEADKAARRPVPGLGSVDGLALAFRMTGETRYADALRRFLLADVRRPNWGEPDLLRRRPVWHAGLGTARDCFGAALAFDSVHDALSPEDRRRIAKGIVDLGVLPTLDDWVLGEKRIHTLDTMGHNWWSACVSAGGVAALAVLDEEPRAAGWLPKIASGLDEWFAYAGSVLENKPATFDPAGGYFESVNYASFALSEYLYFRLAWTNALRSPGAEEIPLLPKAGNFLIDACYPNSGPMMTLDFGDGSVHADGSRPLSLLWDGGFRNPDFAWYLNGARTMSYREGLDRTTPLGLVYFPTDADLARAPRLPSLPPSAEFPGVGWAMLRSSWARDATLLGVRAGYTWNHSHADAGSFILFHRGENLIVDSGNCNYARPEYDAYYRQSPAHNVVLLDGKAENPEDTYFGSKFSGSVSRLIDAGDLKYVMADATGPTVANFVRNYRHFLWIGDVILIVDDVEGYGPGQFEWLLHTAAPAVRRGLDLRVDKGRASVLVRPLFPAMFPNAGLPADYPEKMKLVELTGLADHAPDAKVPYYAFVPYGKTRRTKFITAITLVTDGNRASLPQIEPIEEKNVIGARIRQGGTTTDVYLNLLADNRIRHRNANATVAGWETDAYLAAFTFPSGADEGDLARARRIFVADGSYLRRGNEVLLDSLSKVYATWTDEEGRMDVILRGQPTINAAIGAAAAPREVRVDGRPVEAPYDPASRSVSISLRG